MMMWGSTSLQQALQQASAASRGGPLSLAARSSAIHHTLASLCPSGWPGTPTRPLTSAAAGGSSSGGSSSGSSDGGSSSSSPVVDQMIDYVERQCKGKHEQAVDVLRSGLSRAGDVGLDVARLHATLAAVEAERCNWRDVMSSAGKAAAALQPLLPGSSSAPAPPPPPMLGAAQGSAHGKALAALHVLVQAGGLAVRTSLLRGRDEEALQWAVELTGRCSDQALQRALAVAGGGGRELLSPQLLRHRAHVASGTRPGPAAGGAAGCSRRGGCSGPPAGCGRCRFYGRRAGHAAAAGSGSGAQRGE